MAITNPYLPGWEYVPDGEPHVFGNRIYIYGSHDKADGSVYCQEDYTVWSAPLDNLEKWICHGVTYRKEQDPHNRENKKELWAPDVCKAADGKYYMYYCCAFAPEIGIAVADSPEGPFEFYDYVRDEAGEIWNNDLPFDPGVLFEDSDHIYLYSGFGAIPIQVPFPDDMPLTVDMVKMIPGMSHMPDEVITKMIDQIDMLRHPSSQCTCMRLAPNMKTVIKSTAIVPTQMNAQDTDFEGHAFYEASSMRKIGDTYYFVYSSQQGHELCYATSKYPDRNFKYGGIIISNADLGYLENRIPRAYYANNHGGMIQIKDQWYIFYHRHTNKTQFSRQGCAEKITILPDGSIPQVEMTSCGMNNGALPASVCYSSHICCNLMGKDGACEIDIQSGELGDVPYITEENTGTDKVNEYIANLKTGDICGIKYLSFNGENRVTLTFRGHGTVKILLDGEADQEIGGVLVNSEDWKQITCSFYSVKGIHSVFFQTFDGRIDFSDVHFENA